MQFYIKLIAEQQINRLANLPCNASKCNELIIKDFAFIGLLGWSMN